MAIITEDYVSFETAKLLKDKGFLKGVDLRMTQNLSFYDDVGLSHNLNKYYDGLIQDKIDFVVAPTIQMAIKWLRKVHNVHVVPKFDFYAGDYTGRIYDGRRESAAEKDDYIAIIGNRTYEEAAETAIKYCLENLI